ncbi:MAG TPA: TonB-dependent receptor [Pseudomonas sp.]|uniref:TonB-dependent receptor plug domain-containing protein n=1 Tax=Pseudomonas sp. TaxID=306 RepID=UPI002B86A5EC|nr:TonB-dependent receptor [Pseudomonas sp.]HTO17551.1 TonB-dependent receptor [Pseudomonas sp.]
MKLSRLALAIALASPAAFAANETPRLDKQLKLSEVVVTASRTLEAASDSSASVSVFTRADIDRLRPATVQELLTHVPGVQVANYGGRGASYGLYIRGTSTAQSLILVDGVRVGSATMGGASLQYLNVDQIERVEVLRGSRSAIYGADAMGGVIQVFTRSSKGQGLKPFVRLAGGSDNTWERTLGLSGGDAQTRFNLSASLEETDGFDRTQVSYPSDADDDAYRNRALSLSLSHRFNDSLEAGLKVLDQRGKTEIDNPFGRWDNTLFTSFPAAPYDEFAVSSSSLYVDGQFGERWNSVLELGHSEDKQENFDKLFPGSSVNNTYRDSAGWLNTFHVNDAHRLLVGLDYLNDKVSSSNAFDQTSRWNQAAILQHRFQGESFGTELGVRHDQNEQFGHENTFNAALSVSLNADHQMIVSYAEGFRVPTFADLYWPDEGWTKGNPDLQPERSRSYELKWRAQLATETRLEASAYRTDFRDLLVYASDPITWVGSTQNLGVARINGFEASLEQELLGWQAGLGISVIDPRNRETGRILPNRAKRTLSLDLDRQFGTVGVGASWRAVSRSFNDATNTQEIAGHGVLDLRASWKASNELGFDLKLANILDKDYSRLLYSYNGESYGYREAPFSLMLGVTWTPSL